VRACLPLCPRPLLLLPLADDDDGMLRLSLKVWGRVSLAQRVPVRIVV